jgi:uncharacterized protein
LRKSFENLEINFEQRIEANKIFEKDLVPGRIIQELSLFSGQTITPGKTLIFFDEVQNARKPSNRCAIFLRKCHFFI